MKTTLSGRFRPVVASALALVFSLVVHPEPASAMRAASGGLGPPIFGLSWSTSPTAPCDSQEVRLLFRVCECQVDLVSATRDSVGPILIRLRVQPDIRCVTCHPDTHAVDLGLLRAGSYAFNTRIEVEYTSPPDSTWPIGPFQEPIEFMVSRFCQPGNGIPFLERVVIGTAPCDTCPPRVCPNDSIDVLLEGTFPTNCMRLVDVRVAAPLDLDPNASPLPSPYSIGLLYGVTNCDTVSCEPVVTPWEARVRLPGLPVLPGITYELPVSAFLQSFPCNGDPSLPELIGRALFPFNVTDDCSTGTPGACYNVAWSREPGTPSRCNAFLNKLEGTRLTFRVGSTVPISGVQGKLQFDSPTVHFVGVSAARDGWAVQSSIDPNTGVLSFIAFAGNPAQAIPPTSTGIPQDLLLVTVAPNVRGGVTDQVQLAAVDLLVSDAMGHAIRPCPFIETTVFPPPWVAILCYGAPLCDANGDQLSDVRDLVTMVNCLYPPPNVPVSCSDSTSTLDCDNNGQFAIEDVFCCAQVMLGGDQPVPVPDSLRAVPDLALRFGLPRDLGGGAIEVPLDVAGLDLSAAARFDVAYPDTRYDLEAVEFTGFTSNWWAVHVIDANRARVMLLDLASMSGSPGQIAGAAGGTVLLKLRLRDGASPGGELTISGCDFAAADGIRLTTPNAAPRLALGAVGRLALSVPRPNPFRVGTTMTLTLPSAGAVDAAVYNAAGRRVATLKKEPNLDAGVYELSWDGKDDAGSRAAGGVYFLRVVTASGDTAKKLLFLPDSGP